MRRDRESPEELQRKRAKDPFSLKFFIIAISLFIITIGVSYIYFRPKVAFTPPAGHIGSTKPDITKKKDTLEDLPHRLYSEEAQKPQGNSGIRETSAIVIIEDAIRDYIRPYGVRLLDLYMDREGIVYIDLSNEIIKNFRGDAIEEYNLISGLYNTIKKAVPTISSIKLLIEGKEIESIGGHIDISKPIGGFDTAHEEDANRNI